MLMPRTVALLSFGLTVSTSPLRPLSLPASTTTLSPLRIFCISPGSLQNFRRERDDLHVVLGAQLARNRSEDAGADRLFLVVDEHGGVLVEADHAAVRPANVLGGAHHHRLHHVALLDAAARDRLLDRHDDDVADRSILPLRAAQHLDAHDATRTGIIRDVEVCLHLNHDWPPSSSSREERAPSPASRFLCYARCSVITTQRLSLEIGFDSSIDTMSPTLNVLFSSCALYFLVMRTVFCITGCVKRRST